MPLALLSLPLLLLLLLLLLSLLPGEVTPFTTPVLSCTPVPLLPALLLLPLQPLLLATP
jgi:hypothetical protein